MCQNYITVSFSFLNCELRKVSNVPKLWCSSNPLYHLVSVGKSQMSHIGGAVPVSFVICQPRGVRICQLCHATLFSFVTCYPRHFLMVTGLTPTFFPHFSWNSALGSEAPSSSGLGDLGELSACTFTALYLLANQPFHPKELNLQALDFILAWLWQPSFIHLWSS